MQARAPQQQELLEKGTQAVPPCTSSAVTLLLHAFASNQQGLHHNPLRTQRWLQHRAAAGGKQGLSASQRQVTPTAIVLSVWADAVATGRQVVAVALNALSGASSNATMALAEGERHASAGMAKKLWQMSGYLLRPALCRHELQERGGSGEGNWGAEGADVSV